MNESKAIARSSGIFSFIATKRAVSLLVLIIVYCLIFSIIFPNTFGTFDNFSTILLNMSAEAFIVVAMVPILISGEIDLSFGSMMAFGSIFCGRLMIYENWPMGPSIAMSVIVAMGCGLLNGYIVSKLNVVSFIATLATGMIYLGLAVIMAGTGWTNFPDPMFSALGQSRFLGLQLPVYYMIAAFVIYSLLLARTRYFRQLYYIGGNIKAAELSGINIAKVKMSIYVISAVLACLAGIVSAMRFNAAMTSIGTGVEMRAVTASVIGGVAFTGGYGTMVGAAMGALFVACLNNSLTIAGVRPDLQYVVTGVVLILAIVSDILLARRKI